MNYLSYTLQIHDYLMELKYLLQSYSSSQQITTWIADIDRLNEKLENMRFQVAVVGEFKRGKTSFINALLRKQVLPADVLPATATINRITYGNAPSSYIYWKDGRPVEKVEIDRLSDYITKLTDKSAVQAGTIKEAVVEYPCRFCENSVDLIDTPGMNDDDAMNSVTIRQLADIDLAIVTLDPNTPVSNTEANFIAQLVESDQICQIVFVVSKMDTIFSAHRERLLKLINERLQKLVRSALLENHDENDTIMQKYAELFTKPIIFPVSNTMALHAYEMGDQQALEDSGFRRLNEELLPLIIRTQHSAAIMTPLNAIVRISMEFIQLLKKWEQRTIEVTELQTLKKKFAETVYDLHIDSEKLWCKCLGELNQLQNEHIDMAFSAILDTAYHQNDNIVIKVQELFQSLSAELVQEERDFYLHIWNEYLYPNYDGLCQQVKEITQPYPDFFRQIEPELNELVNCASLSEIPPEPEPFYWDISPIPPNGTPQGYLAYIIDKAVRNSFSGYYQRRQPRIKEFICLAIQEHEEKTVSLVQKLFHITKSAASVAEYIQMDNEALEYMSTKLDKLVQRCDITKEKYIKESKAEN